jgi:hypothetical protein
MQDEFGPPGIYQLMDNHSQQTMQVCQHAAFLALQDQLKCSSSDIRICILMAVVSSSTGTLHLHLPPKTFQMRWDQLITTLSLRLSSLLYIVILDTYFSSYLIKQDVESIHVQPVSCHLFRFLNHS